MAKKRKTCSARVSMVGRYRYCKFVFPNRCGKHGEVLLSALFSSSEGYSLGSIDVGDAYLIVEQEEPTVVEVDGEYYELGFTLPGQRIGSSAWSNKLKGYLEEYGMKSDDGLPALFSKDAEQEWKRNHFIDSCRRHGALCIEEDFEKLVEFLKRQRI